MSLSELVKMSNKFGSDEKYVLAGGGNTSFKENNTLYVKGSGTALATIKEDGFVKMDRSKLNLMMTANYPENESERENAALKDMLNARLPGEENKRPSVEALLHNLFNEKFVLHVHPALVNGLTCGVSGKSDCMKIFGNDVLWIDVCRPGYILAKTCFDAMKKYYADNQKYPQIIFLQNHGIFISADSTDEIEEKMNFVFEKLSEKVTDPDFSETDFDEEYVFNSAPAFRVLFNSVPGICEFFVNKEISDFIKDKNSVEPLLPAFTPDHLVYCKSQYLVLEKVDDIAVKFAEFKEVNGYSPKIVIVLGVGVFALGTTKKEADTAKSLFIDSVKIAHYAQFFGGYLHMSDDFIAFICNWEAESYRQKAMFAGASVKRLNEKVSIVTGSAQGFGAGIAEQMVSEGAYVVIADMNYDGAKKFSDELNLKYGNRTIPVSVNVTDEDSVRSMILKTVLAFGGLDVFVNNAGVVRSGPLDNFTLKDFQFVTNVNYSAYFLCVKYACLPMKVQRKYNPSLITDIIEVNSKSGLEGSNKNFAYAGSKFGGLGLTQSFALELAPYGIKVNAICPGNFLNGPLWSDPERGLFVQYLKAGKVPGAKTVDDVRKFYEAKVPLGRGCEPKDVARALFYIVEQEYETGQAVPVTGGQVMLS